ncbi:uncharacterized protein A4U43_C04F31390 [Asparagus officinalis]|uniref:SKP1 component POZ domain-containing protein n=1 Tax=Asparagus officinalis TaxID=4686 RepID=A0A5P1F4Y4_ASPOF|nr:uncharacterized protein A4U43_C04F31390 [Asparagus officinalis]
MVATNDSKKTIVLRSSNSEEFEIEEVVAMESQTIGIGVRMWEGFRKDDSGKGTVVATVEEIVGALKRVIGGGVRGNEDQGERARGGGA